MRGVLTIGTNVINLDDSDIIKDSVYITNQCTNGSEYEYGCVYAGECGLTIKSDVDRYSLYDAELKLYWSLWTGTEWEEIPLGVFYISEPTRINDKIKIKALDCMTRLDINVNEDTQGTTSELVAYIAEKCGIELTQTAEELSALVNAEYQFSLNSEHVKTYRDALAYICMLTASFATIDRYGKLKLVQYATSESVTLTSKQRYTGASFSDYTTVFVGIKARFIAEENYAPYEVGEAGTGLVLDMGDIPIMRGLPETKHTVLNNVFNVLKYVSYTPFELTTMGNPAIDLGDYVKNEGVGKDQNTYLSPVTYSYWSYRGKHKLRAVGGNPKLSGVVNKEGKQISSLESTIETKTVVVKEYRNAEAITFGSTSTEIARINYAATENSKPLIMLSIRLTIDLDGVLVLQFYTDGVKDADRTYKKYLERGEHFVTVTDIYNVNNNDRHSVSVMASMEYFESDTRKHEADVQTYKNFLEALNTTGATVADNVVTFPNYEVAEINTAIASASIKKGEVCAILYGQGVSGEGKWDGTINLVESIKDIAFSGGLVFNKNMAYDMSISNQTPIGGTFALQIGSMSLSGGLTFNNPVARVHMGEVIKDYTFSTQYAYNYTFDKYITTNNGMFSLKTIYNYNSAEEAIDSGKMCSVALDYTGIDVESVVVNNG